MMPEQSEGRYWKKLDSIDDKVAKVDKNVGKLETKIDHHYERMEEHAKKIRTLELRTYGIIAGIIAALLAQFGFFGGIG